MHPPVTGKSAGSNPVKTAMGKIWFTADTHFGHRNICKYANRPFASIEDMDEAILQNINADVRPDDTLYHLGDFAFGRHRYYRERIACKNIVLVLGNHDRHIIEDRDGLFSSVHTLKEIKAGEQSIVLCHYAMRVWNKSHHGAWHLYGHSHGSLPDDPNSLSFDVGVDCTDFRPFDLADVARVMKTKTYRPVDHHGTRDFEAATRIG